MVVRKTDIFSLSFFVFLSSFYSCKRISTNHETSILGAHEIKQGTPYSTQELLDSGCYEPEFMINGIALSNEQSLLNKIDKPVFLEGDNDEFPKMTLCNKSNQKLTLLSYPGDTKNNVSYFILEHSCDDIDFGSRNAFHVSDSIFVTNYGLTLNISGDVVRRKYAAFNIKLVEQNTDSTTILSYVEDDYKRNHWLKKYNMPEYTVRYYLTNNTVRKLEFGFRYP